MSSALAWRTADLHWSVSLWQVALLALLLLVFLITLRRAQQRLRTAPLGRRLMVLGAHALLFVACVLVLAPPSLPTGGSTAAVLITEGGSAPAEPDTALYALGIPERDSAVRRLATPGQLQLESPGLSRLTVMGHGLSHAEWQQLPASLLVDWQPPALRGIVEVHWPTRVTIGAAAVITGRLRDDEGTGTYDVVLNDPAGVQIARQSLVDGERFAMSARAAAPGPITYRLQLWQGDRLLSDDPVAFQVTTPDLARFQVIQSAPSYDTRQFANWAADQGASVLIQSQISRDRDLLQRINLDASTPAGLGAEVLDRADLLLLDGRRWASLTPADRSVVLQAVQRGLGVMLTLDDALSEWIATADADVVLGVAVSRDAAEQARWLQGQRTDELAPIPVSSWRIELNGAQTLTQSIDGETLESWLPFGEGRIAVSRLRERHQWLTRGNRAEYTRYWARIISLIGRPNDSPQWLSSVSPTALRVGDRAAFCATYARETSLSLRLRPLIKPNDQQGNALAGGETPQAMRPHSTGAPEACGFVWPPEAGWQQLELLDAASQVHDTYWAYVLADNAFQVDRRDRRQAATRARQLRHGDEAALKERTQLEPLSRWWGWSLLLLSLAPLWLERRLSQLQ